jgi:hypothetical protein
MGELLAMRVKGERISDLKFEISDLGTAREGEGISDLKFLN